MTISAEQASYKLQSWFSPSYPVGAFSYSHGLEYAVEVALVNDARTATVFIRDILRHGTGQLDANILAASYKSACEMDDCSIEEIAELAAVFVGTKELKRESHAQGEAFLKVTSDCWPCMQLDRLSSLWPGPYAYSVVVGIAAAGHEISLHQTLNAYLHAFCANLVSAAVRLVPLGQTDGQKIIAELAGDVGTVVERSGAASMDALGTSVMMVDWCSMKHEDQYTRLFRS